MSGKMNNEEFTDRVKKTFGNLFASVSHTPKPSSLSDPLWSLTGTQIEKREWRRDQDSTDRDNNPCASSFDDFVSCARKNSRNNLEGYENEFVNDDDDAKLGGLDDWDLRGSIGLDSTLDHEDEEDAYDKLAIGRESTDDRYYMSAIKNNNVPNSISRNDLSLDSGNQRRDPRANILAARIRLKEDDAELGAESGQRKTARPPPTTADQESVSSAGDGVRVKPILKRKDHESTSKPSKRVRFDPEFVKEDNASLSGQENLGCEHTSNDTTSVNQSLLNEIISRVPDYVQNPSKYSCSKLESTDDMNDQSSSESCLDVLDMVKKLQNSGSRSKSEDVIADLPKSVTFVPKKKPDSAKSDATNDGASDSKHPSKLSTVVAGFIDDSIQENDLGDMDVDEHEKSAELGVTPRKQDRQYRSKLQADEPEQASW